MSKKIAIDWGGVGSEGVIPEEDFVILTGEPQSKNEEIISMIDSDNKIKIYNFPAPNELNDENQNMKIGIWKAKKIKELGIEVFYEDTPDQIQIIKELNPKVKVIKVVNGKPRPQFKYVCFTFDGAVFPIAKKLKDEGNTVFVCQIEDPKILDIESWVNDEKSEQREKRLKLYDGILMKLPYKELMSTLKKIAEKEKDDYFFLFDFNSLCKISEEVLEMGFTKGIFPTYEDFDREKNRAASKDFVKENYEYLKLAETKEFSSVDDVIEFVTESEKMWVVKSDGNFAETLVPVGSDIDMGRQQVIAELNADRKNFEKGSMILEEKIIDAIEFCPQIVFWDGKPVYTSVDIETRMFGAADTGPQTGGNQNININTNFEDPINKMFFPEVVHELAKDRKGLFIFDAGILADKEGNYYFTEFAGNRWGWGGIFSELSAAECGGTMVSNYFEAVASGDNPYSWKIGSSIALYLIDIKHDEGKLVQMKDEYSNNLFLEQVMQKKGQGPSIVAYRDYDDEPFGYVVGRGNNLFEAAECAYEHLKCLSVKALYYRPLFDFLSRDYISSIANRLDFLYEKGLISVDEEVEKD